ncbi:hypothetical protein ScPMuIL_015313 [Solemya velum]
MNSLLPPSNKRSSINHVNLESISTNKVRRANFDLCDRRVHLMKGDNLSSIVTVGSCTWHQSSWPEQHFSVKAPTLFCGLTISKQ